MTEQQMRQLAVDKMRSWLGYSEANGKYKQIIDLYNTQNPLPSNYKVQYKDEWCATTFSAVFVALGMTAYAPSECSCGRMIELYKKKNLWVENDGYTPKIGDGIIYAWKDSGIGDNTTGHDHIGMVTKVSGKSFTVTEGNKGSGSTIVGDRQMKVNGKYIRGFVCPDYAGMAKTYKSTTNTTVSPTVQKSTICATKAVELEQNDTGFAVKLLQYALIDLGYLKDKADGSFGPKTLKAVKDFQLANSLLVDGSVGAKTWECLLCAQKG